MRTFPESEPHAAASLTGLEAAAVYDGARLAEIARLGLDRPSVDAVLSAAVLAAAGALALPIGLVTIVLDEAQFFLAHTGLDGWMAETHGGPVEWSFCRFAVASQTPFVVEDARAHPLVRGTPPVTLDGLRCYAGVPLVTSRGVAVGTLCVAGEAPRAFDAADVETLRMLATDVVAHLERRAAA
jgi:GAF domain-containing protein